MVLDWAGFAAGVSYCFDDGHPSQLEAYPTIDKLGIRATFYLCSAWPISNNAIWAQALAAGHELGNHTGHHCHDDGGVEAVDIAVDTDDCTAFLESRYGTTPLTMAAPYGDSGYARIAQERFLLNRSARGGLILPGRACDPFDLPSNMPARGASAEVINQRIESTRAARAWQILTLHGFVGGADEPYQPIALDEFVAHVRYVQSLQDVWIDSVVNIGTYWLAQRLFSELRPEHCDETTTWSWTLPKQFPPNRVLRVTLTGGILSQRGRILPWCDQGYYELDLDAGELTLTPE